MVQGDDREVGGEQSLVAPGWVLGFRSAAEERGMIYLVI